MSERAVSPCPTAQGGGPSLVPLSGDCHEDETERINPEPDLAGTAGEWIESNGSPHDVASRDPDGAGIADDTGTDTGIGEDDLGDTDFDGVIEAVDVALQMPLPSPPIAVARHLANRRALVRQQQHARPGPRRRDQPRRPRTTRKLGSWRGNVWSGPPGVEVHAKFRSQGITTLFDN
ncbi:MAG: hypothetical protein WA869_23115 [Alloacidobacterium sp.]